ncbi:MAG TPA: TIGR04222 domain-containing membrane protein [Blastococcus sp.]|nr:TIGR04222 domain-containing membrane protein [Blastococcus sp.]
MTAPVLDLYDIACLAGGPDRVVDTALVALVEAGHIRVHSPGQLATTDLSRRHPVEAAVLDAVGPTGHRSVDTIRWRLHDDDRLLEVCHRLQRAGLLGRTGAVVVLLHGHRRALAPTRAGRRALHELRSRAEVSGQTELVRVALEGPQQLGNRLRAEIFERPMTTLPPPRPGHRSRGVDHSDPHLAAYRPGGSAASSGAFGTVKGGY